METTMSERTRSSRWTQFLLMLPFFLIGVAIPVYYFGFSGDGPPKIGVTQSYEPPSATAPAPDAGLPGAGTDERAPRSSIVAFMRGLFESAVDSYVAPGVPPLLIKLGMLLVVFVAGFIVVRLVLALTGALGGALGFLIHKAAGPMFFGFLTVGSTWGIHQTVAQEFGMTWAAATVSLTAAIATLFALSGVRLRG
jgi:hypothetical protein